MVELGSLSYTRKSVARFLRSGPGRVKRDQKAEATKSKRESTHGRKILCCSIPPIPVQGLSDRHPPPPPFIFLFPRLAPCPGRVFFSRTLPALPAPFTLHPHRHLADNRTQYAWKGEHRSGMGVGFGSWWRTLYGIIELLCGRLISVSKQPFCVYNVFSPLGAIEKRCTPTSGAYR